MGYVTREMIDRAKEMDLLTYLQTYEPQELVHFGGSTYCTREHDSLKISNGKWCWFSRGIGGRTALDYLIKVKEIPFTEAVERIVGRAAGQPPISCTRQQPEQTKTLLLPQVSRCAAHAVEYLHSRGIDYELIDFCIRTGRLYESYPHHNAVFVGKDKDGQPRYACLRGIGTDFKGEATGSDKRFSFSIPAEEPSPVLYLFESAIDLLSFAAMAQEDRLPWRSQHLLSLAGVYQPSGICRWLCLSIFGTTGKSKPFTCVSTTTLRAAAPPMRSGSSWQAGMLCGTAFLARARIITIGSACGKDYRSPKQYRKRRGVWHDERI